MKFRRPEIAVLRERLDENNFYEDIIFKDKFIEELKNLVTVWMYNLQEYKQIRIEKFKELFKGLDEIAFPIRIKNLLGSRTIDIVFFDNEGKEYYMSKRHLYEYDGLENYIIGRRNSSVEPLIDREFYFKILKDKTIILMKTTSMRLKSDGKNDDIIVGLSYNYEEHTTEAELRSFTNTAKIKIKYPTMDSEFDKKVLEFLFSSNETTWYYYDVLPILKWIISVISDEKISISIIAEIEKKFVQK